jgi:hypothetical protein
MVRQSLALAGSLLIGLGSVAHAEVKKDKDLPSRGVLSSTTQGGLAVNNVAEPFGGEDPSGREVSPITGSVVKAAGDRWRLKVFNNSDANTYSVDVEVVQLNSTRALVKRDAFTYVLKPKASKEQTVVSGVGTKTAQLVLTSYTNLTARKEERAAAEAKRLEDIKRSHALPTSQLPVAQPGQAKKVEQPGRRAVVKVDGKTVEYDETGAVKVSK